MKPARETLSSDLARRNAAGDAEARIRESAILLIAIRYPEAAIAVEDALEGMTCIGQDTGRIRDALMDALASDGASAVDAEAIALLEKIPHARAHLKTCSGKDTDRIALMLREAIQRHQAQLAHLEELRDARIELPDCEDAGWAVRVSQANQERRAADQVASTLLADRVDETGESGIQRMLDREAWRRQRSRG